MTELAPYKNDSIIQSYDDLQNVAKTLVASGYFTDTRSISQAIVKILAGREVGIGPFASMRGVNIIKGSPSYNANIMASMVKSSGRYSYRVASLDDTKCEIVFKERVDGHWEDIGSSSFSIADAKKAGTQNIDKFPRNMLFARAMSNGVKWFCPDVMNGQTAYVPEEMGEVVDSGDYVDVVPAERVSTDELNRMLGMADYDETEPEPEPAPKAEPAPKQKASRPLAPEELREMLKRKAAKSNPSTLSQDSQIRLALKHYFQGDENKRHDLQNFLLGVPSLNSKTQPADGKLKMAVFNWLKIEDAYNPDGTAVFVIDKNAAEEIELIMATLEPTAPALPLEE